MHWNAPELFFVRTSAQPPFFHGKTNGFLVDYLQVVCGLRPLAEFIPGQFRSDLLGF
jgi:hypothetical protein